MDTAVTLTVSDTLTVRNLKAVPQADSMSEDAAYRSKYDNSLDLLDLHNRLAFIFIVQRQSSGLPENT